MAISERTPRISIGPIPFFWPKQQVIDFYDHLQYSAADIFYLGETVCSKRRQLRTEDWFEIAKILADSGKEVLISSLALVMSESELSALKSLCRSSEFVIEANDLAAVNQLSAAGLPFVCGPTLNIYNARTLALMQKKGAERWVMPVELSGSTLSDIIKESAENNSERIETEVFSYGHLPLAYSARCFTARHLGLSKDDCQFRCMDYPEGLPLFSQEQQQLFNINGVQTKSAAIYNLLSQVPSMQRMGVDVFRLSPRAHSMDILVSRFSQALINQGESIPLSEEDCNGYWFGKPGMNTVPDFSEA